MSNTHTAPVVTRAGVQEAKAALWLAERGLE